MQPGQLIAPGNDGPTPPNDQPTVTAAQPTVAPAQELPTQITAPVQNVPRPEAESNNPIPSVNSDASDVSWTASEFIEHQKPHGWYALVVVGGLAAAAVLYIILHDLITSIVVAIAALLFGIGGARKPRSMNYRLSRNGLQIAERTYPYSAFKAFSVMEEGAINSIQLFPLKRFMPPINLYFPPDMENRIVELLADYLPHEERDHDAIDRLMKRMHF